MSGVGVWAKGIQVSGVCGGYELSVIFGIVGDGSFPSITFLISSSFTYKCVIEKNR